MTYTIAIPSYKRALELPLKTLATLQRYDVSMDKIFVFVVEEEVAEYQKTCPGFTIVSGHLGLINQRMFIESYFDKDTNILFMDDDVSDVFTLSPTNTRTPISDFNKFVSDGFLRMNALGVTLWSIYPVDNTMFMSESKSETIGLTYCVGAFYGQKNTRDIILTKGFDSIEDRERTILRYLRDGRVLRLNHVGLKTKYFAKGGLMTSDRQTNHQMASEELVRRHPTLVRLKVRKNGYTDCQIKSKTE
jgi:hypothetical protein